MHGIVKAQAEHAPWDSPWECPCFKSGTVSTQGLCLVVKGFSSDEKFPPFRFGKAVGHAEIYNFRRATADGEEDFSGQRGRTSAGRRDGTYQGHPESHGEGDDRRPPDSALWILRRDWFDAVGGTPPAVEGSRKDPRDPVHVYAALCQSKETDLFSKPIQIKIIFSFKYTKFVILPPPLLPSPPS